MLRTVWLNAMAGPKANSLQCAMPARTASRGISNKPAVARRLGVGQGGAFQQGRSDPHIAGRAHDSEDLVRAARAVHAQQDAAAQHHVDAGAAFTATEYRGGRAVYSWRLRWPIAPAAWPVSAAGRGHAFKRRVIAHIHGHEVQRQSNAMLGYAATRHPGGWRVTRNQFSESIQSGTGRIRLHAGVARLTYVNRLPEQGCPLQPPERPPGCPKRDTVESCRDHEREARRSGAPGWDLLARALASKIS